MLAHATVQRRIWERITPAAGTAVIAHRGSWGPVPENTLDAFEAAITLGVDMIEFDVRCTGDGRLVVHHDPALDGMPLAGVRASALPFTPTGTRLPRLEEVLELAQGRVDLDVELKERGCVDRVVPLLRRYGLEGCVVTSFHPAVVREVKAAEPELCTGLLIGRYSSLAELFPGGRVRRTGADVLVIHHLLADAGALTRARVPCLVWTVNSPRRIDRHLRNPRVAGVITDVPATALAVRGSHTG